MTGPTVQLGRATNAPAPTGPAASPHSPSLVRRVTRHQLFWPVVALVALIALCGIKNPAFLSVELRDGNLFGQLIDIARISATPLLLALGMALVIATGGIDLSVGAIMAISLAVSLSYIDSSSNPEAVSTAAVALLLGLAVALLAGVFNGFMVASLGIQPFIATMILMVAGRGVAMLITQGQITTVKSAPFKFLGSGSVLGIPTPIIIALLMFVLVAILVRRTALGMLLESIGINREASRLAGVQSRTITWLVYIVCALLAGLAGIVYGAPTMAADANNIGLMKEMDAIMCVVLGGTALSGGKFYLSGTVVGALILSTIERAVVIFHIPSQITPLFKALVIIIVCVAQSPRLREILRDRAARLRPRALPEVA
ncbi:ABC transporter permease [Sanguibacter sp. A247]|uniref:ABC transporter permease n=1 Tax=unclassified Sanguibacter TaxID=2645534 RepID=UPI003FD6E1DE